MTHDMFKAKFVILAVVCKKFIDTREVHERVVKDQRELSALEKLAVDPERRKNCLIYWCCRTSFNFVLILTLTPQLE